MSLATALFGLAQGVALIALAPGVVGLLRWLESRLQRRQGPPVVQPYRDLVKLLGKPAIRPGSATRLFALTPYLLFTIYGTLAFMVPTVSRHVLLAVDLLLIVYSLGLARFVLSLAGLDGGGGFGGLGAGREMFLYFLTELGLILVVAALALRWRTTDVVTVFQFHWGLGWIDFAQEPEFVLLGLAMLGLILFEAERIPIDNPATHLELTMAQKAITLSFAGRDLALVEWAEAVKLTLLFAIAGGLFVPLPEIFHVAGDSSATLLPALLGFATRLAMIIAFVVLAEVSQPKRRLRTVPRLALTAAALSATAILYLLTLGNLGGATP